MNIWQLDDFLAEHTREYQEFGFRATIIENVPFWGPFFAVSNRMAAAEWAIGEHTSFWSSVVCSSMSQI